MVDEPETRFAQTPDGRHVAFQVVGDGPIDVLVTRPTAFGVDMMWEEPRLAHFLNGLSAFCRHIWFDPRGVGSSDWLPHEDGRLVESTVEDMVAVLDAVGSRHVALLGLAVPYGLLFAATHPERTTAVALVNVSVRFRYAADYEQGLPHEMVDEALEHVPGSRGYLELTAPSLADDTRAQRWFERAGRLALSRGDVPWRFRSFYDIDLRGILGSIRAPTLVVNRRDGIIAAQVRFVADQIESAKYVELPGADSLPFVGDTGPMLDAIEAFLTGKLTTPEPDRVLATVLFTDLVSSTAQVAEMGDRRWRNLLATHDALVRTELDRFRGTEVKSTGDGVLAIFDGPGRAIRCACAIRDALGALGFDVRAGLHTGEIELRGEDIAGLAVHIGQRVSAQAGPGEVFISRTVADLVAGSDIELHDEGERQLKGVPGNWQLYRVANA